MVELRLAGHHVSLLGVVVLLASNSAEHVELLANAARHRTKPEQENDRKCKRQERATRITSSVWIYNIVQKFGPGRHKSFQDYYVFFNFHDF